MMLTDRFADALVFAESLHRCQTRKGNSIPYVAHLLAVSATVLEHGGSEDAAIAALLHDAVEDQGGIDTLHTIERKFGSTVARIVLACSDSVVAEVGHKEPWAVRKSRHIEHLRAADSNVALVTAADKLHNLTAIIRDLDREGPRTLKRFSAPGQLVWYFREIADALRGHEGAAPIAELRRGAARLEALLVAKVSEAPPINPQA